MVAFRQINVERQGEVFCLRLSRQILDEDALDELVAEIRQLFDEHGARKIVLCLGPQGPRCLYSSFLAKLVHLRQRVHKDGGNLVIAHAAPEVFDLFHLCGLDKLFHFYPDLASAVQSFAKT